MLNKKTKICIASVHPQVATGYGVGTRTLLHVLLDIGYDVCVYSIFGNAEYIDTYQYKDHIIPIYPTNIHDKDRLSGLDLVYLKEDFDILWTFFDMFAFPSKEKPYPVVGWCMLDAEPFLVTNYPALRMYDGILAVSKYAEDQLNSLRSVQFRKEAVLKNQQFVKYLPVLCDDDYYLTDYTKARDSVSEYFGKDIKGRLFSTVAANLEDGGTERKNFPELFLWWKDWVKDNPDDYLYLHTHITHPRGLNIHKYLTNIKCPTDNIMYANPLLYSYGEYNGDYMRMIYNATDYMIVPSHSEGFGMPYIESAMCGAHPIGNNFGTGAEVIKNCKGTLIDCVDSYFIHGSKKSKSFAKDIRLAVERAIESDKNRPKHRTYRNINTHMHYSISSNMGKIEELIEEDIANHFKSHTKPDYQDITESLYNWQDLVKNCEQIHK